MTEQELQRILNDILLRCFSKDRVCYVEGCNKKAIHSHLLQKNGILSQIAVKDHVYEVQFKVYPKGRLLIKKEGINKAFAPFLFCPQHDDKIFKAIEKEILVELDYHSILLYSLRAVLKEHREKEIVIDYYTRIINGNFTKLNVNTEKIKDAINAETLLSIDLDYLVHSITDDLSNKTESYYYKVYSMTMLEVCASAVYSLESIADSISPSGKKDLLSCVVVSIIPFEKETKMILLYHKEVNQKVLDEIESYDCSSEEELIKKVSDLLIKNISTWICSENFYESNVAKREKKILELMNYYTKRNQFLKEKVPLNLFVTTI